jgi:hypothetical protein
MHLHEAGVLNVHWTQEIEFEWTRNVVAKQQCIKARRAAVGRDTRSSNVKRVIGATSSSAHEALADAQFQAELFRLIRG